MAPGILRRALAQKPFRPIRVFTGDGTSFDIKSPEFCHLSPKGRTLVVFDGDGSDQFGNDEGVQLVDVFLITKVETQGRSEDFKFAPSQPGGQESE